LKIIIVGAGEVGFHIAGHLVQENKEVVVIDTHPEALRRVSDNIDAQVIVGSGSSPKVLKDAGIEHAEILLAVTNSDETNLVACLMAHILSPATKQVARLRAADFDDYHQIFHDQPPRIDTIINPEIEVVKTIERLIRAPGAVDINEFGDGRIKFVSVRLEPGSVMAGVKLADLGARSDDQRILIASVVRDEELIIPRGDDRLEAGDLVYFICKHENLSATLALFDKDEPPLKSAVIVGGGRIGLRVARMLEKQSIYTKIIEKDANRCLKLAELLDHAVVLNGDGSDQELLNEENIAGMDAVITVTNDEETNILASLLTKRMGVRKTITRISKFSYFPLMSTIGIEQVVSPRLSAINTILQHIRKGKVLSAVALKGEKAEVMEAVAQETSDIVGKPLSRIRFPKDALVTGIIRGQNVIIPRGDSVIEPGDRIIILARRQAIAKVEKILAVKLEYF